MKSHLVMLPLAPPSQRNEPIAWASDVHRSQISSFADSSPTEMHYKESCANSAPILAIQHRRQHVSEHVSSTLAFSGIAMSEEVQVVAQPLLILPTEALRRSKRNLKSTDYKIPDLTDEEDDDKDEKYLMTGDQARIIKSYRCGTCRKRFRSRKVLRVHRIDHSGENNLNPNGSSDENDCTAGPANGKSYKCQVCGRVFKSSHGLGVHKKVHLQKVADSPESKRVLMIDLNEPAPADDSDDFLSQVFN